MQGAPVASTLRDESERPHEVNRTALVRARARMIAAGVDSWDLSHSRAPLHTLAAHATVHPVGVGPAAVAPLDHLSKPAAAAATVGAQTLASTLGLSQTVDPRPDVPYFGRNTGFTRQHHRGIAQGGS